jgi:DNA repair exonuclease SbcCD nuclease subunit
MSALFKKAVFFTDLHYGLKNNSAVHNKDCNDFIDWAIDKAKKEGCETCFFLGDWHNHRASMNAAFSQTFMIPGNHDLYFRDTRDVSSMVWARNFPNVHLVEDWFSEGGVVISPWLIGDEHLRLAKHKGDYLLGHFELPGYYMNSMVQMPDHGNFKPNSLANFGKVYSGHFHKRQAKNNVWYIGNCFPHNFSDVNDDQRGIMIKEYSGEEEFYAWPGQPRFRSLLLSHVLENPRGYLVENGHVKVHLDIEISFEEAAYLKEHLVPEYNLREMTLVKIRNDGLIDSDGSPIKECESVDKLIMDQIVNIQSQAYDPAVLLEIYKRL